MDIVSVIRKLCEGKNAFHDLFDKMKTYDKLLALADDKKDAELFGALLYGNARNTLIEMINDAYNFKKYAVTAHGLLVSDGLDAADAKRAIEIFFKAFGFPGYREMDQSKVSTVSDTISENFTAEYEGEVQDGKEYGVGTRTCYSNGKWCNYDECVWIDGVMCGYDYAKELEFGAFEDHKIGFVVNDNFVGNIRVIPAGDYEPFNDTVKKFSVKC